MKHPVYRSMVTAVINGALKEPFTARDVQNACRGFGKETYQAFIEKHCIGNVAGNPELFRRTSPGVFEMVRPFKYGT